MASADWSRLYRLSLYLLCELHPSRSLALPELHFPIRAAFTHLAHCLALSRSHAESRSLSHQLPHGTWYHPLSTSHTVSLYPECIRLTVCRATGQPSVQRTDTESRTVRRTTERTGNIHCCMLRCCCFNCCCAHTVLPTTAALLLHHTAHRPSHQPLLHYYCTIQHTTRHTNLCCTMQSLLHRPLLHRPLLP